MDGMTYPGLGVPAAPSPLLGILYAEDFDDPPVEAPASIEPEKEPEPAAPQLTQDDVDRACAAAVAKARAEWEASERRQHTAAVAAMGAAIDAARLEAEQETAHFTEAAAQTVLAALAGALPHYCRQHGPAEVRAIVGHLAPALRHEPRISVRANPALVEALQNDVALLEGDLDQIMTITAAPLEPGDVRITWGNGAYTRDTAKIVAAMQDALAQLGLSAPLEAVSNRRTERVE